MELPKDVLKTARIMPRKNGKRNETHYLVACPECGYKRWLNKTNATRAIVRQCKRCACRKAGKKGYQRTLEKHGRELLLQKIAERPQNDYEKTVYDLTLGLAPEFRIMEQVLIGGQYVVDIALYAENRIRAVIEVNGYHHNAFRRERDKRLESLLDCPVLFVDASLVNITGGDNSQVANKIMYFLQGV